jgi:hypothetical protein
MLPLRTADVIRCPVDPRFVCSKPVLPRDKTNGASFIIIPAMNNTVSGVVSNAVLSVVKIVLQHRFITRRHVLYSRGEAKCELGNTQSSTFCKHAAMSLMNCALVQDLAVERAVGRGRAGRTARPRPTALLSPRFEGKTRDCYCSCWALDNGREDARNMLSCT